MFDGPATDGPATLEPDPAERRARLRLARSARIGPVTFHEALQHFGSARAACARLAVVAEAEVTREQEALERAGGRFLLIGDAGYPAALGAAGFVIASGLARGIDAAAHQAALATGTMAVLAGGIDQVYPPQNAALQAEVASRGLLLSESPWGVAPVARAFPRRNRIVSGLSAGVVVIEAAARSGSLITAHRAAEQGRDVF